VSAAIPGILPRPVSCGRRFHRRNCGGNALWYSRPVCAIQL